MSDDETQQIRKIIGPGAEPWVQRGGYMYPQQHLPIRGGHYEAFPITRPDGSVVYQMWWVEKGIVHGRSIPLPIERLESIGEAHIGPVKPTHLKPAVYLGGPRRKRRRALVISAVIVAALLFLTAATPVVGLICLAKCPVP